MARNPVHWAGAPIARRICPRQNKVIYINDLNDGACRRRGSARSPIPIRRMLSSSRRVPALRRALQSKGGTNE
jgi:hypothetical protein